jgi:hypothetical protein
MALVALKARLLLCRGSRAARLALGGRKQSRDDTHDLNVRSYQIRSQARPRRGAAARHARLHERCYGPAQCLSGAVGTLCGGWRRSCEVRGNRCKPSRQTRPVRKTPAFHHQHQRRPSGDRAYRQIVRIEQRKSLFERAGFANLERSHG